MIFPELLGSVLASDTLEDLLATCVVAKFYVSDWGAPCNASRSTVNPGPLFLHTRVVILKVGEIVNILIDNDIEVIRLVVRRNVGSCECLGHAGRGKAG